MAEVDESIAALERATVEVGDRWTLLVVAALLEAPRRFGDIERALPGIAPNVLSDRLRKLEAHGLVMSEAYSERPPRFVYELTAVGCELAGVVRMLADWGARRDAEAEPVRHAVCGTDLEARWYCPTCERAVDERAPTRCSTRRGAGSVGASPEGPAARTEAPGEVRLSSVAGRWVLVATILGSAIGFLDATVVNVALPQIGAELGTDVAGLQ